MDLNLEKQLVFYGQYHHDKVNMAIHIICVPVLLFTGFLFGTNTPSLPLPTWLQIPNVPPNAGTVAAVIYSGLYMLMEPVAGAMLAPMLVGGAAYASLLTSRYGARANYVAVLVHILSWLAQFVGHGAYEGRAPALLDNLFQAIFLAPLFVWLEILFFLGYRPALKARLEEEVRRKRLAFETKKKTIS